MPLRTLRTDESTGVPHRVREDDEYMGYHVPKDSTIVVNIRQVCASFQRTLELKISAEGFATIRLSIPILTHSILPAS